MRIRVSGSSGWLMPEPEVIQILVMAPGPVVSKITPSPSSTRMKR
jgi:hypothetical protein